MEINEDDEFASAFNEGEEVAPAAVGLSAEDETQVASGDGDGPDEGLSDDAGQTGGGTPETPAVAVVLNAEAPADAGTDAEKEAQRLRSWEGRLKARERELAEEAAAIEAARGAAKEAPAAEQLEGVADAASAGGSEELAQAAAAAAEAVEDGEISAEQAMAQLREDFGDDFVKVIQAVVKATAKSAVAQPAAKKAEAEPAGDGDDAAHQAALRAHFDTIASKHPDYQSVGSSQDFKSYIESLPPEKRADAEQVAKGGTAEEVVALLDAFKGSKTAEAAQPSQEDTATGEAMEELEGVRSAGVRLPDKPQATSDNYEAAWENF